MRPAQVLAAALAAITAAFVGSRLGVYGTVIGAGVISLATTVGGELYLRSLDRTKHAALRTKEAAMARAARTTAVLPTTRTLAAPPADGPPATTAATEAAAEAERDDRELVGPEPAPRRGLRWPVLAAGALAAFVLGMAAVTGIELITGNSLSGDDGRTISNVLGGRSGHEPEQQQEQPAVHEDTPPTTSSSQPPTSSSSSPESSTPESPRPSPPTEAPESTGPSEPPTTTESEPQQSELPGLPPPD
ncbi:MAG: hypothetical protein ACRDQF_21005 [Thermocrispum sp.]